MDINKIVMKYKANGYVTCDKTYAIIVDSGPEWGPDEYWEVKYCGTFSEERIRECISPLLQKLREECENLDGDFKEYIGPVRMVERDWEDKQDCFEKVELRLWSMGDSMLELNVSVFARRVMHAKDGGWRGFSEYSLRKMKKKKMLEWMNGETIVDECAKMIGDRIKEYYIE